MKWFRKKPKPKPEYRMYGCFYNYSRHRWELCSPTADIPNLHTIPMWEPFAAAQVSILTDYDSFQSTIRSKVQRAELMRDICFPHADPSIGLEPITE